MPNSMLNTDMAGMHHDLPDPLVVMALEQESDGLFRRAAIPVLYTGVGKVNATYYLTLKLTEYGREKKPLPLVINFGTAGSRSFPVGSLVACNAFFQRDMNATALGFDIGATPFDGAPLTLQFPAVVTELPHAVCGTGDSFSTSHAGAQCSVVDMEAYALAKVCRLQGATFTSVKYITDGADSEAGVSWQENLRKAAEGFLAIHAELIRHREPR